MHTLDKLAQTIAARVSADPDSSWTAKLLAKGPEKCAEKFGEEAVEAIIEAIKDDKAKLTSEAADVLFHLLVMLQSRRRCTGYRTDQPRGQLRQGQPQPPS